MQTGCRPGSSDHAIGRHLCCPRRRFGAGILGIQKTGAMLHQISVVRLPSIVGLEMMREGQTAIGRKTARLPLFSANPRRWNLISGRTLPSQRTSGPAPKGLGDLRAATPDRRGKKSSGNNSSPNGIPGRLPTPAWAKLRPPCRH